MTNETSSSQEPTRTACLHAMFDAAAGYGLKTCSTPTTKNPASPIEDANQSWLAPDAHLLLLKLPTKKVWTSNECRSNSREYYYVGRVRCHFVPLVRLDIKANLHMLNIDRMAGRARWWFCALSVEAIHFANRIGPWRVQSSTLKVVQRKAQTRMRDKNCQFGVEEEVRPLQCS